MVIRQHLEWLDVAVEDALGKDVLWLLATHVGVAWRSGDCRE